MISVVKYLTIITLAAGNNFIEAFLDGDMIFMIVVKNILDGKINFEHFFISEPFLLRKYMMEIIFTNEEILVEIKVNNEVILDKQLFNFIENNRLNHQGNIRWQNLIV